MSLRGSTVSGVPQAIRYACGSFPSLYQSRQQVLVLGEVDCGWMGCLGDVSD